MLPKILQFLTLATAESATVVDCFGWLASDGLTLDAEVLPELAR